MGHVLCHDITRIVKDVTKDTAFRKGHIVTEEDIPVLLSLGKDHLYVWEKDESMLHENEAAQILCEDEISQAANTKEALEEKAKEFDALQDGAAAAAKRGYVDNIISGSEIRKHLIYALQMFGMR